MPTIQDDLNTLQKDLDQTEKDVAQSGARHVYQGASLKDWTWKADVLPTYQSKVNNHTAVLTWGYTFGGTSAKFYGAQTFQQVAANGSVPLFVWAPTNSDNPADTSFSLDNIVNGKCDSVITTMANNLKGIGTEMWIRFAWEMNGTWYPWSRHANYVAAWRHIVQIFRSLGATNVKWVWCPNLQWDAASSFAPYFPGDDWIDFIGLDGYNKKGDIWRSFADLYALGNSYTAITALSAKPLIICEVGCDETSAWSSVPAGASKAQWITDMYDVAVPKMNRIHTVVWYNVNENATGGDQTGNFAVDSSPASLAAFKAAIAGPLYKATYP